MTDLRLPTTAVIIDTETDAAPENPGDARVLEIGFAVISLEQSSLGQLIRCGSWLVHYPATEAPDADANRHIHGINNELMAHGDVTLSLSASTARLNRMLSSTRYVIAHNARFDRGALEAAGLKTGLPWVCTYEQFRWPCLRPSELVAGSQISVALRMGVGVVQAHRAIADVLTLQAALARCSPDLLHLLNQARGRVPVEYAAEIGYADRHLGREHHFRWDSERRLWVRWAVPGDLERLHLPFPVAATGVTRSY